MKLSLVVAQGVHEGKVIPIPVAEFVIGRDEGCQLRPASAAVSKKHCGLFVRGEKVFARDMGSTNGTFVNEQQITEETELKNGDHLTVGPLYFTVRMEATATHTPLGKSQTPGKPAPKAAPTAPAPDTAAKAAAKAADDSEQLAALLLATDDGPGGPITEANIPSGTTVFEMPAVTDTAQQPAQGEAAKAPPPSGNTSDAADAILRKYMRRPRQ